MLQPAEEYRFGDLKNDKKRKSWMKYSMCKMFEDQVVLQPITTRRKTQREVRHDEMWESRRWIWWDKIDREKDQKKAEKQKREFWDSLKRDDFTLTLGDEVEELIEEKLEKEFPEDDVVFDLDRIQARMNGDSNDGDETDETEEESLDKESKDQNYFPSQESANAMLMANEWACSSGETQDELWIGDSGASSHLIGDESILYNKKPIKGSVSTASGARMNMLCEGNMDVKIINKKGDAVTGTLHVKVANGMKQKLFSFMQALLAGWRLQGEKKPNGDVEIVLTHPNFRPIYFD